MDTELANDQRSLVRPKRVFLKLKKPLERKLPKCTGKDFTDWAEKAYPAIFNRAKPVPLAVNIHRRLWKMAPDRVKRGIKPGLHFWCHRKAYQKAVAKGGPRYDLSGGSSTSVSPAEMAHAQEALREAGKN